MIERKWYGSGIVTMALVLLAGCGQSEAKKPPLKASENKAKATAVAAVEPAKEEKHGNWWCSEHGIPEADCSMCSAKVADAFKKKGDWCEKHDRAKSQCFICDPKLKDKYAALYVAKYGKEPPPIEEEEPKAGEKK